VSKKVSIVNLCSTYRPTQKISNALDTSWCQYFAKKVGLGHDNHITPKQQVIYAHMGVNTPKFEQFRMTPPALCHDNPLPQYLTGGVECYFYSPHL